jgi:hypothetical protein
VAGFRHACLRDRKMGVRRDPFQEAGGKIIGGRRRRRFSFEWPAKTRIKKAPVGEEVDGRFS